MIRVVIYTLFMLEIIAGCAKQKDFPNDLVGKWRWGYSLIRKPIVIDNVLYGHAIIDTIYPMSNEYGADFTASIEINERGSVALFKNQILFARIGHRKMNYSESGNLIYTTKEFYDQDKGAYIAFYINLSTRGINRDTLLAIDFPYDGLEKFYNTSEISIIDEDHPEWSITNIFVRN